MNDRRDFMMKLAAGMVATSFVSIARPASAKEIVFKNVFIHHVFFWLKEPTNIEARNDFEKGLQGLITVPQIQNS